MDKADAHKMLSRWGATHPHPGHLHSSDMGRQHDGQGLGSCG